ncbi:hypothetical protein [Pontibacter harenae]|uniref:hypothetical protein n=1 Tax=Pontibacter harenae TaxID=2894083 RepID=UPI001E5004DA|nr:hypothetical protein [Pontibacter harenae]MCC9167280.1 hypothetical protein [Pontibacter harenae]
MIILLFLCLQLNVGVIETENTNPLPAPQPTFSITNDTVAQLTKVWVLRKKLQPTDNELKPVYPSENMELIFYPDYSYTLIRQNEMPNAVNGEEIVEEGRWEMGAEGG